MVNLSSLGEGTLCAAQTDIGSDHFATFSSFEFTRWSVACRNAVGHARHDTSRCGVCVAAASTLGTKKKTLTCRPAPRRVGAVLVDSDMVAMDTTRRLGDRFLAVRVSFCGRSSWDCAARGVPGVEFARQRDPRVARKRTARLAASLVTAGESCGRRSFSLAACDVACLP